MGECTDCIVKGLDKVLEQDVKPGDGIAVTTGGHTTYMLHSCGGPQRWYFFDSMTGEMVCVVGSSAEAFRHAYGGGATNRALGGSLTTGLESNKMYTGVVMRQGQGTAQHSQVEAATGVLGDAAWTEEAQVATTGKRRKRVSPLREEPEDVTVIEGSSSSSSTPHSLIMAGARQAIEMMHQSSSGLAPLI